VDLTDKGIIRAIATSVAQYVTMKTFATVLRALVVEELSPTLEHPGRLLSETEPFPFSRPTFEAGKTVFNLVAADNEFERDFAHFLQDAIDVTSFAKFPRRFGFTIEYTDSATNLRYYEPDFVAVDTDGRRYVIETKGQENVDVAYKDRAARIWCENATLLTGVPWSYVKVPQVEFSKLQPTVFSDAVIAFGMDTA
jgi:type III restriction enzyme